MLAERRGIRGMDDDVSGAAGRSICCAFGVQGHGPSYIPNRLVSESRGGKVMVTYKVQADRMLAEHNFQTSQRSRRFEGPTSASGLQRC